MHGDIKRFDSPAIKKLKKGDTLIVCGDFGFVWDNSKLEQKILKKLGKKKFNICFVDGTHENFELLNGYPVTVWNGGKVHNICGNLFHLMRGQIFKIDNMTFFTMGGGESPDIDIRFEENAWSKFEIPSREELLEGAENIEKAKTLVDSEFRDRVDFLGYCNRETIKREIDSCSFACIPSYFETFGMVALEIMSRNKALIFTERTAGREIIIDGVDGLLVNPKDINQIANKIQLLLNDKYYRDQIAEKGYNKIKEKFVVSKIVSQLEDFYKDIALLK